MQNTNRIFYGFATSIKERISILKNKFSEDNELKSLKKWRARKSLLNSDDFNSMLKKMGLTAGEFDLGISEITEEKLNYLFEFVKKQEWYQIHVSIFKYNTPIFIWDLDCALRFHLEYYKKNIKKYIDDLSIQISSKAINDFVNMLKNDLLAIAKPTLVWDVHDIKDRFHLCEENDKEEFKEYINLRFSTAYSTEKFFLEYPVLSRLLATRLIFALNNFKIFINSILESSDELVKKFNITTPSVITSVAGNIGDTHNHGKSSLIFTLNDKKFVYKYHSNSIRIFFNEFLEYISHFYPEFSIFCLESVSAETYCIEEFIPYSSCDNLEEIEQYYVKYGSLIAVAHWLGTTDLHMENLIAHGKIPVLIDVETLLLSEERRVYSSKMSKNKIVESESAIISGLLPMQKYWKRQLDFSALNGMRQKLPFKVRRLLNEKSSKIMYELQEEYLNPSQNVPMLNKVPITLEGYKKQIIDGYYKSISVLLKHKKEILEFLLWRLSKQQVRVILRDTQDYSNFLNFARHPSCMSNYIEYEKIFENLWSHSFLCNEVVLFEIDSLLNYDIPYFYTYVNSLNLLTNDKKIKRYFKDSMKTLLYKRISRMNESTINLSLLLIKESINDLHSSLDNIIIPRISLHKYKQLALALDIKKIIDSKMIVDEENAYIIWAEISTFGDEKNSILYFPDSNFYDGSSGIYVFLYALRFYTNVQIPYLDIMEKEVFSTDFSSDTLSAFWGQGAQILAGYILFQLTQECKFMNYIVTNIKSLLESDLLVKSEWLRGAASLMCLLAEIIDSMKIIEAEYLLRKIVSLYMIEDMQDIGFAHGYSGVLFSLIRVNDILKDSYIDMLIEETYEKLILKLDQKFSSSWCKGTLGINRALQKYSQYCKQKNKLTKTCVLKEDFKLINSCICHGEFGYISKLLDDFVNGNISIEQYQKAISYYYNMEYKLYTSEDIIPLGMFTGIAGIGYQFLRTYDNSLYDVLFFTN